MSEHKDGMTAEELGEFVRAELRNAGLEDMGEKFVDGLERYVAEQSKKSGAEQARDKAAMFRQAIAAGGASTDHMPKTLAKKSADDITVGGIVWAKMAGQRMGGRELTELAEKHGFAAEVKALQAGDFDAGGSMIPEAHAAELIEFLRPVAAVRDLGAVVVPMPSGGLTYGRMNSGATAYWVGESEAITESQPGTGQLKFSAKKLATLVPMSNDLLRRAPAAFAAEVQRDIVRAMANAEDIAFLRGSGSENTPKGLTGWVASDNQFDANGTVNLDNVTIDLVKALYLVEKANHIQMVSPGWLFNPRTAFGLMLLKTTDGYYPFMREMSEAGTLLGYRFRKTNNVTRVGGAGSDEGRIFFGDWGQYRIGDTLNLQIERSDSASYGSSNAKSAFARDETVIRAIHEVDGAPRHTDAFSIINAVTYGASLDS
jgi:HK97 family phage major capsid protein